MKLVPLILATSFTAISPTMTETTLQLNDELSLTDRAGTPFTVASGKYKFTFDYDDESSEMMVITGSIVGEEKIKHLIGGAGFQNVDRLFLVMSHSCDGESVDLVIQQGPSRYADIITRSYYRIVFSRDLKSVTSEFYDPSIEATYAVLPLEEVIGLSSTESEEKITCEKGIPTVKYK